MLSVQIWVMVISKFLRLYELKEQELAVDRGHRLVYQPLWYLARVTEMERQRCNHAWEFRY